MAKRSAKKLPQISAPKPRRSLVTPEPRDPHISIHISKRTLASPHVISLSNSQPKKSDVLSAPVFSEAKIFHRGRTVVDFGDLVRQANQTQVELAIPKPVDDDCDLDQILLDVKHEDDGLTFGQRAREIVTSFKSQSADTFKNLRHRYRPRVFAGMMIALAILVAVPYPATSYYQSLRHDTNYLVEQSVNGFLALQSSTAAALATNLPQAQLDLNTALHSFSEAKAVLDKEHKALVYVASVLPVIGRKVTSRQHILTAGQEVALGNTYLVKGIGEAAVSSTEHDTLDRLGILKVHLRGAIPHYETALADISRVDQTALPIEYQSSFQDFKVLFAGMVGDMKKFTSVMTGLETMLGTDSPRRYLVVFQNHHELRATGGFIGSFAIVDVQRGKVKHVEVPAGGSYDLQGQLDTYVKPPLPLQIANARWEFQDGNWFPDFPASAQKLAWFYEHSRGSSVDGVIAINASVLERVLKVLGPVKNDQFSLLLNADDALEKIQTEVETGPGKIKNKPKAVIASLLDQLLGSIQTVKPEQLLGLVGELNLALLEKEIQVYVHEEVTEKKFAEFGWTGEVASVASNQDYLFVVNTNLGGAKSDARITDEIEHQAVVQSDGSVLDTVIIRRTHAGQAGDALYGKPNSSYVRVYVPVGAQLVKAGGFVYPTEESFKVPEKWYKNDSTLKSIEKDLGIQVDSGTRITQEFGKTAFGNWITTQPGDKTEAWFTYKLPFTVAQTLETQKPSGFAMVADAFVPRSTGSRYSLYVQKQSGTNSRFSTQIIYPDGWEPVWVSRDDAELGTNGLRYRGVLKTDELFGVVMKFGT